MIRVAVGEQTLFSNNGARSVVLIPDSVKTLSNRAIYDHNVTYFNLIPAIVTVIHDGATSRIPLARFAGSRAQNLTISSEGNGTANVFFINDNRGTRWDLTDGGSFSFGINISTVKREPKEKE